MTPQTWHVTMKARDHPPRKYALADVLSHTAIAQASRLYQEQFPQSEEPYPLQIECNLPRED